MGSTRRKFTPEFKAEAVELLISSGKPIAEIARDLGISGVEDARFRRQSPEWDDCLQGELQLWVRHVGSSPLSLSPRP